MEQPGSHRCPREEFHQDPFSDCRRQLGSWRPYDLQIWEELHSVLASPLARLWTPQTYAHTILHMCHGFTCTHSWLCRHTYAHTYFHVQPCVCRWAHTGLKPRMVHPLHEPCWPRGHESLRCPVHAKSLQLCLTLLQPIVARQAPPSMGFSRQECWSGLPFPFLGDLPDPGIEPRSPALQVDSLLSELPGKPTMSHGDLANHPSVTACDTLPILKPSPQGTMEMSGSKAKFSSMRVCHMGVTWDHQPFWPWTLGKVPDQTLTQEALPHRRKVPYTPLEWG